MFKHRTVFVDQIFGLSVKRRDVANLLDHPLRGRMSGHGEMFYMTLSASRKVPWGNAEKLSEKRCFSGGNVLY